jgi:hypothetical protein
VFQSCLERSVWQGVEAGLGEGNKSFIEASLGEAHAANSSVVDPHWLRRYLSKRYKQLEARLEDGEESHPTDAG